MSIDLTKLTDVQLEFIVRHEMAHLEFMPETFDPTQVNAAFDEWRRRYEARAPERARREAISNQIMDMVINDMLLPAEGKEPS